MGGFGLNKGRFSKSVLKHVGLLIFCSKIHVWREFTPSMVNSLDTKAKDLQKSVFFMCF